MEKQLHSSSEDVVALLVKIKVNARLKNVNANLPKYGKRNREIISKPHTMFIDKYPRTIEKDERMGKAS